MGQYLNKFSGTIGKRQTEQILRLLNQQRNTGQIRSVQEFTKKLEDLVRELTSTTLKPSLTMFAGEGGELITSDTHNFMLDRVQDDLEAAFEEATNIEEVQRSHRAIVRDVILKNLRAGVAELESKISLFEFLNTDLRGFDSAIFSTFRESKKGRTQRGGAQILALFTDPRTNILVPATQDAIVELIGERLTLSSDASKFHNITNIRQVFDDEAPQSELVVEPPGVSLANMIDNTRNTYWVQSLLFKKKKKFIKVKLELQLGAVKEVNFIEIEPASRYGIVLEAVFYADGNNVLTDLEIPEQLMESPVSIRIKKVATDRLVLVFRNDNSSRISFQFNTGADPLFSQALIEPVEGLEAQLPKDLQEILGSVKVKDIIGLKTTEPDEFSGYEFLTGIDNINIGLVDYGTRGIYVSAPLETCGLGQLGLRVSEIRPYTDLLDGLTKFTDETYDNDINNVNRLFTGSIEYWVIKQELAATGALLHSTTFPILPLGVSRVHHERLVLTEKSAPGFSQKNIGQTNFFTNPIDGNVIVFRNGVITTEGSGWFDITTTTDKSPNSKTPMRFRIEINTPLAGDIYTVSYSPLVSSTRAIPQSLDPFESIGGLKVVDLVGDLSARLEAGQIVVLDGEDQEQISKVYLTIILRQNTADPTLTPAVEEYTLVSGCKDQAKFEKL